MGLHAVNTYAGNSMVNEGTLAVGDDSAIPSGAGTGNLAVSSGATLDLLGCRRRQSRVDSQAGAGASPSWTIEATDGGAAAGAPGPSGARSPRDSAISSSCGRLTAPPAGTQGSRSQGRRLFQNRNAHTLCIACSGSPLVMTVPPR